MVRKTNILNISFLKEKNNPTKNILTPARAKKQNLGHVAVSWVLYFWEVQVRCAKKNFFKKQNIWEEWKQFLSAFQQPTERPHPSEILWLSAWKELVKLSFFANGEETSNKAVATFIFIFFFLQKHKLFFSLETRISSLKIWFCFHFSWLYS